MIKFLTPAALTTAAIVATLAAPAFASNEPGQRSFVRDGQTYVYTATKKTDRIILDGRRYPSGSAFQLVVRNGRVNGISGGVPVSFSLADVKSTATTELASR